MYRVTFHRLAFLLTGGILLGSGSCIDGRQLQGAVTDSVATIITDVLSATIESALSGVIQL